MPILSPQHDRAHPVEADTAWSESYYFNAYDPPTDTGFFTRIGIRPNEGTMDVGMSVWLPDGGFARYVSRREQATMVDSDLAVDGVRYRMHEPLQRWQLTMDAHADVFSRDADGGRSRQAKPLRMDVTFDALTPAIGTDGQGGTPTGVTAATGATVGRGHLEQSGRWSGWIELDGVRLSWAQARGNRDKSWGPRRWGAPRMWRWFTVNIGDDTHFGGILIGTDAGDLHRGWVWTEGEHASIREWQVASEVEEDGVTHKATHILATDKLGRTHELHGTILRVEPGAEAVRPNRTVVNEGLARWTLGGRTGYGISEYLHQLDEHARPVVPIA